MSDKKPFEDLHPTEIPTEKRPKSDGLFEEFWGELGQDIIDMFVILLMFMMIFFTAKEGRDICSMTMMFVITIELMKIRSELRK